MALRLVGLSLLLSAIAVAAPPPPRGAHPRLFLDSATLSSLRALMSDEKSGAARAVATCTRVTAKPDDLDRSDDWAWSIGASSCGLAWRLTGDDAHAAAGLRMLKALLDDYHTVGDGAGGDGVVRHDSGYTIRIYAPYAALAYDWLAGAPGLD